MKKALFFTAIMGGSFLCSPVFSQQNGGTDSLGLPGDNLNLYGVLDLFQKSETLEEFEKKLNSEDSKVNNLDLNGNSKIDYISVKDNMKGSAHAIVLQVAINEKENQDVAVIEVEKDKNDKVQIQIVGDVMLYGKDYIIEPQDEALKSTAGGTPNPGYNGAKSGNSESGDKKSTTVTNTTNNYYNTTNNNNVHDTYRPVNDWGIVHFLFFPSYVVYASPWSWGFYPGYWNPWTPLYWHSYYYDYYYHNHYYGYYHRSNHYRNTNAHDYYEHRRTTSATVNQRRESGQYRNTYSRPDLASKPAGGSRSTDGNKKTNSAIDNNKQTKTNSNRETVKERNTQPNNNINNNNKANKPKGNNNQSQPVKQSAPPKQTAKPDTHSSSPKPATHSSGSKSGNGNKGNGGGKKR